MYQKYHLYSACAREKQYKDLISESTAFEINIESIREESIIVDLLQLHEYLENPDKYSMNCIISFIIGHEFNKEPRIVSLTHLLYRISVCYPNLVKFYGELIQSLTQFNIITHLVSQLDYAIKVGCDFLISELINIGLIHGLLKAKYWKSRDEKINELAESIIYDDSSKMQNIISESILDLNTRIEEKIINSRILSLTCPTMIQYSALNGSLNCFKYLYINGARIWQCSEGFTTLSFAIAGGNVDIIQLITEEGYIPDSTDLLLAIEQHRTDIFDWILEQKPESLTAEAFDCCVENEFIHGILLFKRVDLNHMFDIACQSSFIDLVELLAKKYDLDPTKNIVKAAENGSLSAVKMLLAIPGTDVNKISYNSPLVIACQNGNKELVKYLLTVKGIDVNKKACRKSPLLAACQKGQTKIVKILLRQRGIKVNDDSGEEIPINAACERGHDEIAEMLLNRCDLRVNQTQCQQIIRRSKYLSKNIISQLQERAEYD